MSSPQLTPDQAKFVFGMAMPTLKNEHQTTKRVIEAIPLDKGDYRPDDVGKTAVDLAWHIVGAEHRFIDAVINGAFDFTNTGKPPELTNSAEIARWYAETSRRDLERLATVTADALLKPIDFRGLFTFPAGVFL